MENFILKVPKWQGEILFTKDFIEFVMVIFLLVAGLLFCIWGYKYFQTISFMAMAFIMCYAGLLVAESLTENMILKMFISIMLGFLGVCMLYFLSIIVGFLIKKSRIRQFLIKNSFIFTALLGAFLFTGVMYTKVYHNMVIAVLLLVLLAASGLIIQYKNKEKQIQFKTYDDLYKMKPLTKKE